MALVVERRQRHGQHRLYVRDTVTRAQVGYYDCRTGRVSMRDEARAYEALLALRPFLSDTVPDGLTHLMPAPASPEEVIARNAGDQATFSGGFARPRPRLLRSAWPPGSKADRVVARRLARLGRDGWDVLRAVDPADDRTTTGYLVIGPPGVFTVSALRHAGARIRVGGEAVWVDNAIRQYLRNARLEADSAARRLGRVLGDALGGEPLRVTPVLAFVDAAAVDGHDGHPDVLVVPGEQLDRVLRECVGELSLPERDRLVAAAHRATGWSL